MPDQEVELLENGHAGQDVLPEQGRSSRSSIIVRVLSWILHLVIPSSRASKTPSKPAKLRPTAYLDGLRGFAAFIVYFHHHILWAHESQLLERKFQAAWGTDGAYYFGAFPYIRTFTTGGHFAVAIFFVLSGYVLSVKPLSLMHSGDFDAFTTNVGSALFRRWFRLWIPVIVLTFFIPVICHSFGVTFANFKPMPSFGVEIWKWYGDLKKFCFIFAELDVPWFSYSPHTWTIPIELKGSVLVYMSHIALSRCTPHARIGCLVGLVFYFLYIVDGSYYAMFVSGLLIAYIDLLAAHDELPEWANLSPRKQSFLYPTMLAVGLFLGGCPSHSNELVDLRNNSPGWHYLSYLTPGAVWSYKWFFLYWAAVLTIFSIPRVRWLKSFFETAFCQFLGRVSFMLYLVHGPILFSMGDRLYAATGWVRLSNLQEIPGWVHICTLPKAGLVGLEVGFLIPCLILLPPTLWIAEMATRLIDEPSVRFAAFFYKKTLPADRI